MFRQAFLTSMLSGAMALGLAGDAPERGRELMRLVPQLEPQMAGHLVSDTETEFRAWCREIGLMRTLHASGWLHGGLRTNSLEDYRKSLTALYPFTQRVVDALSYEFDRPEFARIYQFRESLAESSWTYAWEHRQCLAAFDSLNWETTRKPMERIKAYNALADRFARFGDQREVMNIQAALASEVSRVGRFDLRVRLLRSTLARALWMREELQSCQLYGELGDAYGRMGHFDSALACYRAGIARADRNLILDQSSRLRFFLARHYLAEGRLSMTGAMLREAVGASRRFGGDPLDIRPLLYATQYYAKLQCWDVVARNLQRFPVLLRGLEDANYGREAQHHALTVKRIHAMLLAATGKPEAAADSLKGLIADSRSSLKPELRGRLLSQYAEALLLAGRAREAIAQADSAVAYADRENIHRDRKDFALVLARAGVQAHLPEVAERAFTEANRIDPDEAPEVGALPDHILDGVAARIALGRKQFRRARRFVHRSLRGLRDTIAVLDRGPYTDLTIMAADDLWLAGHGLLATSATEGLAFERHWRSLPTYVGRSVGAARESRPDVVFAPRSVELVYAELPEGIVRWTATSSGTRRDTLVLAARTCRQLVERVVEIASHDPADTDAPIPWELVALARRLGRDLLPDELRDRRVDIVSVSAHGSLARLPFELLDVARAGTYEPLLSRSDVRLVRYVRPRQRRVVSEESMILADAARPALLQGRPTLPPLPAVDSEVARAYATLPHPRVHDTVRMWKPELLEKLSRATNVYVAAHLVRHPDAPMLSYFPVVAPEGSRSPEDANLDIRDVRDVDMSPCRLVVLSSCASGEPYVAGKRSGPSMADAFVDAGAEAVIHTRWRVRDEAAALTGPRLTAAWREGPAVGGVAWRSARQDMIRGPRGIRHPFEWAAWSVTTAVSAPDWIDGAIARPRSTGSARLAARAGTRATGE